MFENIPAQHKVNVSKETDMEIYWGQGCIVGVELITPQRTAEYLRLKEFIDNCNWTHNASLKNVVGETNVIREGDHLTIADIAQFRVLHMTTINGKLRASVNLAKSISVLSGRLKSEKNNFVIRPVYELKGSHLNNVNDIKQILGFQLLCRDNVDHSSMEPLLFKGI